MSFHDLHHADTPFLLPNAWDVASAVAFADAGFPAVGTTSFGVNATAGHPDGAGDSRAATAALVRALAPLPAYVSADIEDGYSDDPEVVAAFVAELGAAGVNIEDSANGRLIDPAVHAAKITAIKRRSPEVFVNARVDNYWLHEDATVDAVLRRADIYTTAGADGIFFPGATDPDELRALTAAVPLPVNVLATPGRTLTELGELGIRRVSTGSLPYRAAIDAAVGVATTMREGGTPVTATPYAQAQQSLIRFAERANR